MTEIPISIPNLVDEYSDSSLETSNNLWPFTIRWSDQARFQGIIDNKLSSQNSIVILGSIGANHLGIRGLAMIAEAAMTIETFKQYGLGTPQLKILYPIAINAWANGTQFAEHKAMAVAHYNLVKAYLVKFHPDISGPIPIFDEPNKIVQIEALAEQLLPDVNETTITTLMEMAGKKSMHFDPEITEKRSLTYLLAHYCAYGWKNELFSLPLESNNIFLLPKSEIKFQELMDVEYELVNSFWPLIYQGDNSSAKNIVAYSMTLSAPPYFPHKKEPLLKDLQQWPGNGSLFNKAGLNGVAQNEIAASLALIKEDAKNTSEVINLLNSINWPN